MPALRLVPASAGATRLRTEVLRTSVYLELSVGRLDAALVVSFLMLTAAVAVLLLTRRFQPKMIVAHEA